MDFRNINKQDYEQTKAQDTITTALAKDFIGKEVVLKGKIVGTKIYTNKEGQKMLFLDIDDRFPNAQINVVMFDEILQQFKTTESELLNKGVKIKGVINLYRNKPQLIIESVGDLEI